MTEQSEIPIENPNAVDSAERTGEGGSGDSITTANKQDKMALGRALMIAIILIVAYPVRAEQARKIYRVGYLFLGFRNQGREEALKDSLRSLGYIDGQTVTIEWRYAQEHLDRLPELASELVRLHMDVILTGGGYPAVQAVRNATSTVPIVMLGVSDAVELGFVKSLARPGGNITGMSNFAPELSGKLLELTKEAIPQAWRAAVFAYSSSPNWKLYFKQMHGTAQFLGMQLLAFRISKPDQIESSFEIARKKRADALIVPGSAFLSLYRGRIIRLATQNQMPVISFSAAWAEGGSLLSYGPTAGDFNRRAAIYVDKILKGARPADLPIEQPTKFELVINLKTAKQIGLNIPPNLLARADRVVQ